MMRLVSKLLALECDKPAVINAVVSEFIVERAEESYEEANMLEHHQRTLSKENESLWPYSFWNDFMLKPVMNFSICFILSALG